MRRHRVTGSLVFTLFLFLHFTLPAPQPALAGDCLQPQQKIAQLERKGDKKPAEITTPRAACEGEVRRLVLVELQCLNECNGEPYPPGSPAAAFNAMQPTQLAQYCGTMSAYQCAGRVQEEQKRWCTDTHCKSKVAAVKTKKALCEKIKP